MSNTKETKPLTSKEDHKNTIFAAENDEGCVL